AGQKLTMTVSANTISGVDVAVHQPSGSTVASLFVSGSTAFKDVFTLPMTGTYTVTIDPQLQNTGTLTLVLTTVPDNTGTTSIGTPTAVTIGTAGENAVRSFKGAANQNLTLSVTGNTIPGADVVVRQPNGISVTSLSVSWTLALHDTLPISITGTYTVTIDPQLQNTGSLTFTLNTVPDNTGTTSIGTPTTVTIGTVGEN